MAMPAQNVAKELINETMWVVYFLIAKKSPNFVLKGTNIDENFMIDIFQSKGKLSGFIKDYGFSQQLSGLRSEISDIDSKTDLKKATDFFSKKKWHDALQSQVKNLIKNQSYFYNNKYTKFIEFDF